jgi:RES domain-containing protein
MRFFHLVEVLDAPAYCHAPVDRPFEHDALVSAEDGNRWSRRGEPTIYLAGNLGTALVELGRHAGGSKGRSPVSDETGRIERTVWTVTLHLDRVLDLRAPQVRSALRLPDDPHWILDVRRTREIAGIARSSGEVDALRVPSAGLIDRADRWNIIVFADELGVPLERAVERPRAVGTICLERPA